MAVKRDDIFTLRYFDYGEAFTGSSDNLRYRIGREPLENIAFTPDKREEGTLRAYVYPEPFCYEKTPEDQRACKDFPHTEEGLCQAIEWINSMIESGDFS